jgi:hypothetical protein
MAADMECLTSPVKKIVQRVAVKGCVAMTDKGSLFAQVMFRAAAADVGT